MKNWSCLWILCCVSIVFSSCRDEKKIITNDDMQEQSLENVKERQVQTEQGDFQKRNPKGQPVDWEKQIKRTLDAAAICLEASKALYGTESQEKDIVKAYQGFAKAKEMGYDPAMVAVETLCWTMTDSEKQTLEKAGISPPASDIRFFYQKHWRPAWIMHSRLAKFEMGIHIMSLHGGDTADGAELIIQSAKEGLPLAVEFLKTNITDPMEQYGFTLSDVCLTVSSSLQYNKEMLSSYKQKCRIALSGELSSFLRDLLAQLESQ